MMAMTIVITTVTAPMTPGTTMISAIKSSKNHDYK